MRDKSVYLNGTSVTSGKMREYIFRGKSYYTGEWIFSDTIMKEFSDRPILAGLKCFWSCVFEKNNIIPDTVGQLIEDIWDADDKRIFEGDKLEWYTHRGKKKHIGRVIHDSLGVYAEVIESKFYRIGHSVSLLSIARNSYVIGTIHDKE